MASNNLVDSLESMIQCTVCYEIMKEPKMLPCLHRFCLPCLKSSISTLGQKMNFLCPLCRKPTPIPPRGAGSFKTDFIMKQMVDMVLKQRGMHEKESETKKIMLSDPSLLKIDSNIFPKDKWSVDGICSLSDIIVIVGSSQTLNYLLAFTVTGIICFTSDLSPKGSERETPFSSCVAAINDESVVVGCTGRLLIIKILGSRSDFEHCAEIPNNRKPKGIAANSNSIVVHMYYSCSQNGIVDKRFLVYDHSLNFLISTEVDDGDGVFTTICLTDKNFYWVDYYTGNVFYEDLDNFTSETPVEKNIFFKPSSYKCTPLSICGDGEDVAYVLWRILEETDIVTAGGRDCFASCRKVVAQYNVNNPQEIVNQIDVDEKSHRVSILNKNTETKKLVVVTKDNLFYTCNHVMM